MTGFSMIEFDKMLQRLLMHTMVRCRPRGSKPVDKVPNLLSWQLRLCSPHSQGQASLPGRLVIDEAHGLKQAKEIS
jgi:hypothetical protein